MYSSGKKVNENKRVLEQVITAEKISRVDLMDSFNAIPKKVSRVQTKDNVNRHTQVKNTTVITKNSNEVDEMIPYANKENQDSLGNGGTAPD